MKFKKIGDHFIYTEQYEGLNDLLIKDFVKRVTIINSNGDFILKENKGEILRFRSIQIMEPHFNEIQNLKKMILYKMYPLYENVEVQKTDHFHWKKSAYHIYEELNGKFLIICNKLILTHNIMVNNSLFVRYLGFSKRNYMNSRYDYSGISDIQRYGNGGDNIYLGNGKFSQDNEKIISGNEEIIRKENNQIYLSPDDSCYQPVLGNDNKMSEIQNIDTLNCPH